jgi:hypothetical protein
MVWLIASVKWLLASNDTIEKRSLLVVLSLWADPL